MSNYLAIAAVTATLRSLLLKALESVVQGGDVTCGRPKNPDAGREETRINLFLYQVSPNPALRNMDLPVRRPDGTLARRPQAALDLHYLLSFYGKEGTFEPQRMLGRAVVTLESQPALTRNLIENAIAAESSFGAHLAGADLAAQVEQVRLTTVPLTLDDMAKLWSTFFQVPYVLSVAYRASLVLIEAEGSPSAALPVHSRNLGSSMLRRPVVERVVPAEGPGTAATMGGQIVIFGNGLRGESTKVLIGNVCIEPETVSDQELRISLNDAGLRAGTHTVQVLQRAAQGTSAPLPGAASNMAALVLCPAVKKDSGGKPLLDAVRNAAGEPVIRVEMEPPAGPSQIVELLLNEFDAPAERHARAYTLPRRSAAQDTAILEFPSGAVEHGQYLVRVRVAGAESQLQSGSDGRYDRPRVVVE